MILGIGSVGPKGDTGAPGNPGINGVDGADGLPGDVGATGSTGSTGKSVQFNPFCNESTCRWNYIWNVYERNNILLGLMWSMKDTCSMMC